jgi:hypothetical protein
MSKGLSQRLERIINRKANALRPGKAQSIKIETSNLDELDAMLTILLEKASYIDTIDNFRALAKESLWEPILKSDRIFSLLKDSFIDNDIRHFAKPLAFKFFLEEGYGSPIEKLRHVSVALQGAMESSPKWSRPLTQYQQEKLGIAIQYMESNARFWTSLKDTNAESIGKFILEFGAPALIKKWLSNEDSLLAKTCKRNIGASLLNTTLKMKSLSIGFGTNLDLRLRKERDKSSTDGFRILQSSREQLTSSYFDLGCSMILNLR